MRMRDYSVLSLVLLSAATTDASHREAGNDAYKVSITTVQTLQTGFIAAYTGPAHPVTDFVGRPSDLLPFRPDCHTCGGEANSVFFAIRSWSSHGDYSLGKNPAIGLFSDPDPMFDCIDANDLGMPRIDDVFAGSALVGMTATWEIHNATDDLRVQELLRVHGDDWIGSAVEVSLTVQNFGGADARLGVRAVWHLVTALPWSGSGPPGASSRFFIGLRPSDPPSEPFVSVETEWNQPGFRMWEAHLRETPSTDPGVYSIAAAVSGPVATLDPPPTPPDMIQYSEAGARTRPASGGGAHQRCFDWRIPEPPRTHDFLNIMGMTSFWGGPEEVDALVVPPGEEVRVTQYLVAFTEYPLSVDTSGPFEAPCDGGVTTVPVDGRAVLADTTSAPIVYSWSSPAPEVSFVDAASPATDVVVAGFGTFPVTLTVAVGAYEASAETTVTALDDTPPELRVTVTPDTLWPPNHRLRAVIVRAEATDDCGDVTTTLVDVTSSEPRDDRGDGHSDPDIQDADLGTADFHVRLRAERDGRRGGRTYWLRYRATDAAGNASEALATVVVPHDQRGRRR